MTKVGRVSARRRSVFAVLFVTGIFFLNTPLWAKKNCSELVREFLGLSDNVKPARKSAPKPLMDSAHRLDVKAHAPELRDSPRFQRHAELSTTKTKEGTRSWELGLVVAPGIGIPGGGIGGTAIFSAGISESVTLSEEEGVMIDYGCPGDSNEVVMREERATGMLFSTCQGVLTCTYYGKATIGKLNSAGFTVMGDGWREGGKNTTEARTRKIIEIDIDKVDVSREEMQKMCSDAGRGAMEYVRDQLKNLVSTVRAVANGFTGRVMCLEDKQCPHPTYVSHGLGWDDPNRVGRCATFENETDSNKSRLACLNLFKAGERCYNPTAVRALPPTQYARDWNENVADINRHTACDWGSSCEYETWKWAWPNTSTTPVVERIYRCVRD